MKNFLILFFFCFASAGFSQNLVPNPSFEDTVMCPDGGGDVVFAEHWQVFRETPDYFNSCASDPLFMVPYNHFGFQEDNFGQAYIGLYTYAPGDSREMIGVELSSPLLANETYYYSYKVVRTQNNFHEGDIASNKLGIKLLNSAYSQNNPISVVSSQLYTNEIIIDTVNWITIWGYFVADSSYSYISIGNHFANSNTDTIQMLHILPNGAFAYYYIDDVCISSDSSKCEESFHTSTEMPTRLATATFYEDILRINQGYSLIKKITLVDMLGNTLFSTANIKNSYDLTYLSLTPSIYNLFIETHNSTTSIKIIKQ